MYQLAISVQIQAPCSLQLLEMAVWHFGATGPVRHVEQHWVSKRFDVVQA
jgi:hypothetical protein